MKEKELKKKVEDLKDRKIDEEALETVAGGSSSVLDDYDGFPYDIGDLSSNPYAKKNKGKKKKNSII